MKMFKPTTVFMGLLLSACVASGELESPTEQASFEASTPAQDSFRTAAPSALQSAYADLTPGGALAKSDLAASAPARIPLLCGFRDPADAKLVVTDESAYNKLIDEKRATLDALKSGKVRSADLLVREVTLDALGDFVSLEVRDGAVVLSGDAAARSLAPAKTLQDKTLVINVKGAGELRIDASITDTALKNLVIALDDNAHDVQVDGPLPCLVIDGGAEASEGPLKIDGDYGEADVDYTPLTDFYGTNGADTIVGTTGNDNILGYGGNDSLNGNSGNDSIGAGDGDDGAIGAWGSDSVNGNAGADLVMGDGTGTVHGGDSDIIRGGQGNDQVIGGNTADYCACYGDLDYDACSMYTCNLRDVSCETYAQ